MDDGTGPGLIRMTTDLVDARHRIALVGDVMARELAGGQVVQNGDHPVASDWTLAALAPGVVIGRGTQSGITATRGRRLLRDDDADFTLFFIDRGAVPFSQNDRRVVVTEQAALLIAHGRPVQSAWTASRFTVLRLPRAAVPDADAWDRAGGTLLPRALPAMRLLEAYMQALWPLAEAGEVPALAARQLAELAGAAIDQAGAADRAPAQVQAARFAAICGRIRRDYADPSLSMARIAADLGLSERAGYLVMRQAGERFAETLIATRLDRAAERLEHGYPGPLLNLALTVGFSDLSHFNRRFRERFGVTPSDCRSSVSDCTKTRRN